jgi:predicted RNA-binding Zn-ribbon protein involved in translation (DUF1610 family)
MGKATKICTKCKRGLPETATKCSCGCTEILNKKDCDDILNKYHRSSEKEKYQMYQDEQYRKILDFVLPKEEIQTIIYNKNTSNRKYKSYVSISSPISQPTPTSQNIPKCPTCGSTNVERISTAQKAFGFALVGLFSSNLGKTMHCKNCGYKW